MPAREKAKRIVELDLLRGFFILIIILDHMQLWPSPWHFITGEGRLWSSAAEGFFIISGLLIGYLRIFKDRKKPFSEVSRKLLKRAAKLWLWCVIITTISIGLSAILLRDFPSLLPKLPKPEQLSSHFNLFISVISTGYATDWIYFLRFYAIMLALAPIFIWLVRVKKWFIAMLISIMTYFVGTYFDLKEYALQWQLLFFLAVIVGWKINPIISWLKKRPKIKKYLLIGTIILSITTIVISYFLTHGWDYVKSPSSQITLDRYLQLKAFFDPLFSNSPLSIMRILLSFLWAGGLFSFFHIFKKTIVKYFGWLLIDFGENSLTVYCLHAILLYFAVTFMPNGNDSLTNGLVSFIIIVAFWLILKVPLVKKVFPK